MTCSTLRIICCCVFAFLVAGSARGDENWFLAIGHGGHRMLSRDGVRWEGHQAWSEPGHNQDDLNVAVNFKGTFFAGGGYFSGRTTATRDGKTWSDGVVPGSSPIFGYEVFGDVLYAVDLRGKVFKTTDGENWPLAAKAEMPSPTHWIRCTEQGNGLIVGSGDFGPVMVFDPTTEKITVTQMAGQTEKNAGLMRVAFGNGVFVIGGQAGLLAATKDGVKFEHNETHPERGDIQCVAFTGKQFLATTKTGALRSADGLDWEPVEAKLPRQIRRVQDWLYGYSWPPSKISRSSDGLTWEPVPNEQGHQAKSYAYGPLSGGPPPALPQPKRPAAKAN